MAFLTKVKVIRKCDCETLCPQPCLSIRVVILLKEGPCIYFSNLSFMSYNSYYPSCTSSKKRIITIRGCLIPSRNTTLNCHINVDDIAATLIRHCFDVIAGWVIEAESLIGMTMVDKLATCKTPIF